MASPTNSKIGRTYKAFSSDITINPIMMISQEIVNWKNAINAARSIHNPRRRMLLELFDNIKIDGHLSSTMNKREMGITNKRILFEPAKGIDIANEDIDDKIIETPWFSDLMKYACEAMPYGHSLIEMIPGTDGLSILDRVELINRANVIPEWSFVMKNANDFTNGIYFNGPKADPYYSQYLIEVGGKKDYGLLMITAQYVIYKRGGFGDWAQFAELFGMPFRIGKYNMFDDLSRKKLEDGLKSMGGAGYAVIPEGTSLEFHQTNGTGQADIFKLLVEMCNDEMSKTFVGQTMTTDNGSSRSQSQVHKSVEEEINMSDMIRMEYVLNWQFKPKILAISGISDLEKGKFRFPQTMNLSLDKRYLIDSGLSKIIPMTEEYFYRTYGIAKPAEGETIIEIPDVSSSVVENQSSPTPVEKKKLKLNHKHSTCCVDGYITLSVNSSDLSPEENDFIKSVYDGNGKKYDYETFQQNTTKLREGLIQGLMGGSKVPIDYGTPDNIAATMMEININRFGFDKNLAQIYQLNQALKQTGTFSEFKKQAAQVLGNFNKNFLQTEYDTAIAVGQNASAWNAQIRDKKDFPYVKYITAGDDRVRPPHAALDGKIFNLNDSSWTAIYPPNGWNCRCEMISINDTGKQLISTGDDAKQALGDEWAKMQK